MFKWINDLRNRQDRLALERELASSLDSSLADVEREREEFSDLHDFLALERDEEAIGTVRVSRKMTPWKEVIDHYPASRCLDAEELYRQAAGQSLAGERKEHLEKCKLCQVMVETATPNDEMIAAMSKVLAKRNQESKTSEAIVALSGCEGLPKSSPVQGPATTRQELRRKQEASFAEGLAKANVRPMRESPAVTYRQESAWWMPIVQPRNLIVAVCAVTLVIASTRWLDIWPRTDSLPVAIRPDSEKPVPTQSTNRDALWVREEGVAQPEDENSSPENPYLASGPTKTYTPYFADTQLSEDASSSPEFVAEINAIDFFRNPRRMAASFDTNATGPQSTDIRHSAETDPQRLAWYSDAMASFYASRQDFGAAIEWSQKALDFSKQAENGSLTTQFEQRLEMLELLLAEQQQQHAPAASYEEPAAAAGEP